MSTYTPIHAARPAVEPTVRPIARGAQLPLIFGPLSSPQVDATLDRQPKHQCRRCGGPTATHRGQLVCAICGFGSVEGAVRRRRRRTTHRTFRQPNSLIATLVQQDVRVQ